MLITGLVAFGVGLVLYLRSREAPTKTGPVIQVMPSTAADVSTVQNEINTVAALQTELTNYYNRPAPMQPIVSTSNAG